MRAQVLCMHAVERLVRLQLLVWVDKRPGVGCGGKLLLLCAGPPSCLFQLCV